MSQRHEGTKLVFPTCGRFFFEISEFEAIGSSHCKTQISRFQIHGGSPLANLLLLRAAKGHELIQSGLGIKHAPDGSIALFELARNKALQLGGTGLEFGGEGLEADDAGLEGGDGVDQVVAYLDIGRALALHPS